MTIQFTHLDGGAVFCVGNVQPGKGNVFPQHRGAGRTGDDPHLRAPDMNAITVRRRLISFKFEADQFALRIGFSFHQRIAPDEIIFF